MTPHFKLEEFTFSSTAVRLGIDNTPSKEVIKNLQILAEGLEDVRTKLDGNSIHITSGFRCLDLNRQLHSKDSSYHVKGLAADMSCPGYGSTDDVMRAIVSSSIEYQQCILEFNSWIHIAFPPKGEKAKRQAMIIDREGVKFYE